GGWEGWDGNAGAGAPTSSDYAFSGSNSVEIIGSADLVYPLDITGGRWELTAMQYIPSGTTGTSWFILLNQYPNNKDWSVQTQFNLATGAITTQYDSSASAVIVYDQWVEFKCVIDLDNNTVDEYYNGEFFSTHQWDDGGKNTLQVIDLYGNGASSIYYDDIVIAAPLEAYNPQPADGVIHTDTWVNLKWGPGGGAVSHDVYMSDNFDDVNDGTAEAFRGSQAALSFVAGFPGFAYPDGLVPGTTYYWRIAEVGADGTVTHRGDVWSFMIPPLTAYAPSPPDGGNYVRTDVQLSWAGGFRSKLHTVFFGDNFDDVNNATVGVPQATFTYDPGLLANETAYYWRVDEFDGAETFKGDVWSFTTIVDIPISDPNLVGWWNFDEGSGDITVDWSGNSNHGTFRGEPQWTIGYDLGALEFDGINDYVDMGNNGINGVFDRGSSAFSLTGWVKPFALGPSASNHGTRNVVVARASDPSNDNFELGFSEEGNLDLYIDENGDDITKTFGGSEVTPGSWHHFAVTFDSGQVRVYLDGNHYVGVFAGTSLDQASGSPFTIGNTTHSDIYFRGLIDDVRVYDRVLTAEEIEQVKKVNPLVARGASPANGSNPDVDSVTPLTWSPGDNATSHEVYFGTDADAVDAADSSDTSGIFRGRQTGTAFTPAEPLEWGTGPYYWRVDEINTDGTTTKGRLWTFTVAEFILVDDFEGYTNKDADNEAIWQSWIDGFDININGSQVGYEMPPYAETTIVHGGSQSMPLAYDNTAGVRYSEAVLTLVSPRDWTRHGIRLLSLWFKGDAANVAEPLYVALNGTAVKYHDDPAAALITEWTQWIIPLQEFADLGVVLGNVNTISIGLGDKNKASNNGSGVVYIDDIQLNRP
ncbi:MAG: LamG domain-containing protein, partial [Phycisphaerales bacterium]